MQDDDINSLVSLFDGTNPILAGGSVMTIILGALFACLKLYNYFRKEVRTGSLDMESLGASSQVITLLRDEVSRYAEEVRTVREENRQIIALNNELRSQNEQLLKDIKKLQVKMDAGQLNTEGVQIV